MRANEESTYSMVSVLLYTKYRRAAYVFTGAILAGLPPVVQFADGAFWLFGIVAFLAIAQQGLP